MTENTSTFSDTPSDIPSLVAAINRDRSLAVEILRKLPLLINSTGLVQFDLGGSAPIEVPSIPFLKDQMNAGNEDMRDQSASIRALIQEVARLATAQGLERPNPNWTPLDLKYNKDGDLTDPLFRAQIEDGLRLPFDGYVVKPVNRRQTNAAARVGDWLLPNHTEASEDRFTTAPPYSSYINIHAYGMALPFAYSWRYYYYYRYYYGYYYAWWHYRYYSRFDQSKYQLQNGSETGALAAQTFQVKKEQVLLGLDIAHFRPGNYAAAAKPRLLLVECSYGHPDMEKVLARGSFVDDAQYQGTDSSLYWPRVNLDRPVLLKPGKSYAFVIIAEAQWCVNHTANQDRSGGFFQTQDGFAWEQNIAMDIAYRLRFANFGAASVTIEIDPMELSGGIASMKQELLAELPEGGAIKTEMQINDQWLPIEEMDKITSLPPHTPMRMVLTGTADAMPLIDTTKSNTIGFRPATALHYFSTPRRPAKELRITYELFGFNDKWHVFDPAIEADGTRHTPALIEFDDSIDGKVRGIEAVYELPEISGYRHDIIASTKTAAKVFDITSVIERNV